MEEVLLKIRGVADFSDVKSNVNTLQGYLKKLNLPTDITKKLEGSFSKLDSELETFQQHLNSGFKTKGDVTGLEKSGQRIVAEFEKIENTIEGIDTSRLRQAFQIDTSKLTQAQERINQLRNAIQQKYTLDIKVNDAGNKLNGQVVNIQQSLDKLYSSSKSKKLIDFKEAINSGDVAAIKSQLTELENYGNTVFTKDTENARNFKTAVTELSGAFNSLKPGDDLYDLSQQLNLSEQEAEQLTKEFENLRTQATQDLSSGIKNMASAQDNLNKELLEGARSSQNFNDELGQVKSQIQYYFSLVNVAQLLRRAFQDVVETVKTLDEAMTQTAVVTDFTVGDMWEKLPEYTASAKALGVATHELYEATTLYYQQGLDTNASMAAGVETMKMAKIAGMEAAAATDAMTAALRGFNMEVNEENAQRVNDVYSKLAAISASDTEEIATAMSKTASIASSVGAEFENIAVFLAQGIETTRESADSIGTALKTVLARFNELKKDPSEIGEVDGEIVDANKVEAALRSVGIALRDTQGQFRAADEVMLEVAKKWDTMSVMQQRYIATTAAGSRQQSRFIAMMSDYNRTMELQSAAYSATGASQAQYEKTLESLESKMNKLKNTWDEFILGIANNSVIKGTVDALSGLLNVINKMTNLPGILGGVSKGLLAFGAFGGVKTLVNSLASGLEMGKAGVSAGTSFSSGFAQGFSSSIKNSGKGIKQSFETLFGKSIQGKDFAIINTYNEALLNSANARTLVAEKTEAFTNATDSLYESMATGEGVEKANAEWAQADVALTDARVASKSANMAATSAEIGLGELSNGQQEQALLLTQAGIKSDLALIATTKGLTLEELKKAAAQKLGNEASEEEIKQEMEKIILSKMSLAEKIKLKLATLQGTIIQKIKMAQDKKEITGITAKIAAYIAEKFAIDAVKAATISMIIVTGLAAAAVGGLVFAVVQLAKVAKENSLEYKMEQAAEATKRAESAAKAAKDAYEDLLETKTSYTDLQKTLDGLIKGTNDWRMSLIEANQEVVNLLSKYPELSKYFSVLEDGRYAISEEGWDFVENKELQKVENTAANYTLSLIKEKELDTQIKTRQLNNISGKAFIKQGEDFSIGTGQQILSEEYEQYLSQIDSSAKGLYNLDFEKVIQKKLLESPEILKIDEKTGYYSEEFLDFASELGFYAEEQSALFQAMEEVQDYWDIEKINQETINAMRTELVSSEEVRKFKYGQEIADALTKPFLENFDVSVDEEIKTLSSKTFEQLAADYTELTGAEYEQVLEDFDGKTKDLKKEVAKLNVLNNLQNTAEGLVKNFTRLAGIEKETFSSLMSFEGGELTLKEIEDIGDLDSYLQAIAERFGMSLDEVAELFNFSDSEEMKEYFSENIKYAEEAFKTSKEKLQKLIGQDIIEDDIYKNLTKDMTAGAAKVFNDTISSIAIDMGQQGVDSYLNLVHSLAGENGKLSAGGQKILLENLSLINLQDIENAEDLREALDNIGISSIELTDKELKDLNEEIQAMASVASRTIVDIDKAKKAISSGKSATKLLQEAIDDGQISFEEEDYETLKAAGASSGDFFYDGETYTYLGDTVDLLQQIRNDTNAMRAKLLAQVEQDVLDGAMIADWVSGENLQGEKDFWEFITGSDGKEYSREGVITAALEGNAVKTDDGVTWDSKQLLTEIFGLDSTEVGTWTDEYAKAQLQSRYDKYGLGGTQYTENTSVLDTYYDEQLGANAASQSGIENADMYEKATAAIEKYQKKLEKNIELTEEEKLELNKAQKEQKNSIEALKAKEKALGITAEEIEGMSEADRGLQVVEKQLTKNIAQLKEETEDYFEVLKDGSSTDLEKDNALNGLVQAADLYMGLELDKEWLKNADNLETFRKAISGTKEDFYNFINDLDSQTRNAMLSIASTEEAVKQAFVDAGSDIQLSSEQMQNIISQLDEISFDIDGTADFTQIYNAIYNMVQDADLAKQILENLAGTGVDFTVETKSVPIYQTHKAGTIDPISGRTLSSDLTRTMGYTEVPVVTGRLTGGKNYSSNYSPSKSSGGGGGGGGGGGSSDKYEPDYEKYYNTYEKIEKLQEERSILQDEYDDLLEDENATLDEIEAKQAAIVENLKQEKKYQEEIAKGKLAQIAKEEKDNSSLSQYAWFDEELGKVQINWDKINSVTDPDKGEKIDNYISNLESYADSYNEALEASRELEEEIAEYIEAGKNDLDKSFNILEKIEKIENKINKIQAEREILLSNSEEHSEKILESYKQEKELLEQQIAAQRQLNEERINQHKENLEKAASVGVMKYIVDLGDGQFSIDNAAIDVQDQDTQDWISEWVDKLNESGDAVNETTESLLSADQTLIDFKNDLQESAFEFFDEIKNSLIDSYQRQIDMLQTESEAISQASEDMFDSISKSLDRQRQLRENEKTEETLRDKEARLAFLSADTTGANKLEIKNLEKELSESKEDYTDTLIDQKISELQEQNDEAAAQREQQIEIAQAQLDWAQESGSINEIVQTLIDDGVGLGGKIVEGSDLYKLLTSTPDYTGLTSAQQSEYWNDFKSDSLKYLSYLSEFNKIGSDDSIYQINDDITSEISGLSEGSKATVIGEGSIKIDFPNGESITLDGIDANMLGRLNFDMAEISDYSLFNAKNARKTMRAAAGLETLTEEEKRRFDMDGDGRITSKDARTILRIGAMLQTIPENKLKELEEEFGIKNLGPKFATGGLADFTGPAWLDGTKSKPELVLNSRDTANFIQLKDILSSVLKNVGSSNTDEKTGDTYYEIHIDVEKMTSDYDVDDVANRVKTIINQEASYRNNNVLNRWR